MRDETTSVRYKLSRQVPSPWKGEGQDEDCRRTAILTPRPLLSKERGSRHERKFVNFTDDLHILTEQICVIRANNIRSEMRSD